MIRAPMVGWLGLMGCTPPLGSPEPGSLAPEQPVASTLRVCGSSTMGLRLVPRLVTAWLGQPPRTPFAHHAFESGFVEGSPAGAADPVAVTVRFGSSREGLTALEEADCDVAMFSGVWDDAIGRAHPTVAETAVGRDAIMVVAHPGFPLDVVTTNELRSWFTGLRPPDGSAVFVRSEAGSGTRAHLAAMLGVPPGQPLVGKPVPARGFYALAQGGGQWLSFVSAQETLQRSNRFKVLRIQRNEDDPGTGPNLSAVASSTYPLVRDLHLLTQADPPDLADAFVRWAATSRPARATFESLRMLHVSSSRFNAVPLGADCGETPSTVEGTRMWAVPYAEPGDWRPAEEHRVTVRLAVQRAADLNRDLVIVGYASADGPTETNCAFALRRAEALARMADEQRSELGILPNFPPAIRVRNGGPTALWGDRSDNLVAMLLAVER